MNEKNVLFFWSLSPCTVLGTRWKPQTFVKQGTCTTWKSVVWCRTRNIKNTCFVLSVREKFVWQKIRTAYVRSYYYLSFWMHNDYIVAGTSCVSISNHIFQLRFLWMLNFIINSSYINRIPISYHRYSYCKWTHNKNRELD